MINLGRKWPGPLLLVPVLLFIVGCSEGPTRTIEADPTFEARPYTVTPAPTTPPTYTPLPSQTPLAIASPTLVPEIAKPGTLSTATISAQEPGECQMPGQIVAGHFPSRFEGPDRDYRIYLPPCYGEYGRTYPTLYLFHGGAHSDDHWDYLGMDEAAEKAIKSGEIPPLLIVMPNGGELANNSSGGSNSFEGMFLSELIPYIESQYCAWSEVDGRAIGGISRGGYWALEIAFRHPSVVASVGGHSAALLDTDAGPDMNPQETALVNDLGDLRLRILSTSAEIH